MALADWFGWIGVVGPTDESRDYLSHILAFIAVLMDAVELVGVDNQYANKVTLDLLAPMPFCLRLQRCSPAN